MGFNSFPAIGKNGYLIYRDVSKVQENCWFAQIFLKINV